MITGAGVAGAGADGAGAGLGSSVLEGGSVTWAGVIGAEAYRGAGTGRGSGSGTKSWTLEGSGMEGSGMDSMVVST